MMDERRAETASRLRRLLPERRLTAQQVGDAAQVPPAIVRAFIDGADVPRVHYVRLRDWVLRESAVRPLAVLPEPSAYAPAPETPTPRRGRPARPPLPPAEEQLAPLRRRIAALEDRVEQLTGALARVCAAVDGLEASSRL